MLSKLIFSLLASSLLSFLYCIYSPSDLLNAILIGIVLFVPLMYSAKRGGLNGLCFNLVTGLGIFVMSESISLLGDVPVISLALSLLVSFLLTHFRNRAGLASRAQYTKIILGTLFAVFWAALAFNVSDRQDWIIENSVMLVSGAILFSLNWKRGGFSEISTLSIFLFAFLHIVGAHYTYMSVPFGYLFTDFFLLSRSYYDTFVHFLFGVLLFLPFREVYVSRVNDKGFLSYIFPISVICMFALCYEIIEWLATFIISQDTIPMFLAPQGDTFDAQKDMLASLVGSAASAVLFKLWNIFAFKK